MIAQPIESEHHTDGPPQPLAATSEPSESPCSKPRMVAVKCEWKAAAPQEVAPRGANRVRIDVALRSHWRHTLGEAYYHATYPGRHWYERRLAAAGRAPIAVLTFHRVADDGANPWTTRTKDFIKTIRWLKAHFDLISLAELQRRVREGFNAHPSACITFDDGYADNCRVALPLLVSERIPCTYFVTSSAVLEGKPFAHDMKMGNAGLAPNTVEELRKFRRGGIEIGAHTAHSRRSWPDCRSAAAVRRIGHLPERVGGGRRSADPLFRLSVWEGGEPEQRGVRGGMVGRLRRRLLGVRRLELPGRQPFPHPPPRRGRPAQPSQELGDGRSDPRPFPSPFFVPDRKRAARGDRNIMADAAITDVGSTRFAIRPDSLAQSIVLLLSLTLIQRTVGFGRSILLCRWLAPQQLGYWDLTLAFLDLAAPIAVLSMPACFSRYVEHYRQRGQLRGFVLRICTVTFCLIGCSVALIYWQRSWFSHLLYSGSGNDGVYLVKLLLFVLPAVVLLNTINELFSGMRMFRAVTMLQFAQSLLFAGLALSLTASWHAGADSVMTGYGLTCVLCSVFPLYWLIRMWHNLPDGPTSPGRAAFWGRLLPFAGAVWVNNLLQNLFQMTDRYMILHYSGMSGSDAAAAVGQYHSARVVPLLLVQLAMVIGTMFVPYFSCDWEAGRRHVVRDRLNTFLKLTGLALMATAVLILVASPILFDGVFAGKFSAGKAILSWTLLAAMWYSMYCIARI